MHKSEFTIKTTPSQAERQSQRLRTNSFEMAGNGTIRALGCPELPDPPICLRVGILHSRAVGIDVEELLCSCFREAQHCGRIVCSLGGFLDAAAGVNTKPTPVRGSGSPRLPGSSPRVRGRLFRRFLRPFRALGRGSFLLRGLGVSTAALDAVLNTISSLRAESWVRETPVPCGTGGESGRRTPHSLYRCWGRAVPDSK